MFSHPANFISFLPLILLKKEPQYKSGLSAWYPETRPCKGNGQGWLQLSARPQLTSQEKGTRLNPAAPLITAEPFQSIKNSGIDHFNYLFICQNKGKGKVSSLENSTAFYKFL